MAETTFGAETTVTGAYESNPYLGGQSGNNGAATVTASVKPTMAIAMVRSKAIFNGSYSHTSYSRLYRDQDDYSAGGAFSTQLSALSEFALTANYSHRTITSRFGSTPLTDANGNPIPDPLVVEDTGRKLNALNGSASFSTRISPHDSLSFRATVARTSYPGAVTFARSQTSYGASGSLAHTLNSRVSITAGLSYSTQRYVNSANAVSLLGDSNQIYPSLAVSARLTPRLTLQASAGATFSNITRSTGSFKQTSFAGSASLCNSGDRSNLCIRASRSVLPSVYFGLSKSSSATMNYSYRLTPRSSIGADVGYSQTDSFRQTGNTSYGSIFGSGHYQRQLTQRLSAVVSAYYSDPFKSIAARRASFSASIGISYRLGR